MNRQLTLLSSLTSPKLVLQHQKTSFKQQYSSRLTTPQTGFTSSKTHFHDSKCEETGSTLQEEESGCHSSSHHSNMSDTVGLLSIKALFVDKESPKYASKYNSVCYPLT